MEDPNILYHSDVEVVEISSLEGDPFITVAFNCQQLKCTRDRFGNVVEGSPDSIQRVMYMWGLQQEPAGVVTAAGQARPPRWVIRQMVWSCVQALV